MKQPTEGAESPQTPGPAVSCSHNTSASSKHQVTTDLTNSRRGPAESLAGSRGPPSRKVLRLQRRTELWSEATGNWGKTQDLRGGVRRGLYRPIPGQKEELGRNKSMCTSWKERRVLFRTNKMFIRVHWVSNPA